MGSEEEKRFQLSYFLFFVSSGRLDHGGHARVHDRADVDVDGVRHDGARLRRPLHFLAAPIAVLQPSGLMFFVKKKQHKKNDRTARLHRLRWPTATKASLQSVTRFTARCPSERRLYVAAMRSYISERDLLVKTNLIGCIAPSCWHSNVFCVRPFRSDLHVSLHLHRAMAVSYWKPDLSWL